MTIKHIKNLAYDDEIVLMTYFGYISQGILTGIIESLEKENDLCIIQNKITHSISTVLIEIAQNIIKYSKDEFEQSNIIKPHGLLLVSKKNNKNFCIHSENIVSIKDTIIIDKKIKDLKKLNKKEINEEYKRLRRNGGLSDKNGAGIGFYEIAKHSKNIEYKFIKINENKYNFNLTVEIKKGK